MLKKYLLLPTVLCALVGGTANAAKINWADWTSGSDASGFTGQGVIVTATSTVKITYSNPQGIGFYQVSDGKDYWQNGRKGRHPISSPFTSDFVENIPTGTDIIALKYAGVQTLVFSETIANPVFSYVSLNGNGYAFDQDFEILSFGDATDGNDCGYWGCGTSYKEIVDLGDGNYEYRLLGKGEPHGTLRFTGAFNTVTWRSLSDERWNGFTVGIEGTAGEGAGLVAPRFVELILDGSGSMKGRSGDGLRKIKVAKDVLHSVIRNLPKDISVALRVYGHRLPREPKSQSCLDTEMVSSFAPLVSSNILEALDRISPQGQTPIGFSLSKLAEDFSDLPGHKLVVLVSDGIETCNSEPDDPLYPPTVIRDLIAQGIELRINVVGFDIGESDTRRFLENVAMASSGSYFAAANTQELERSLRQAISVPFSIRDAAGEVIANGSVGDDPLKIPVGIYTLELDTDPPTNINEVVVSEQQTEIKLSATANGIQVQRQ